MMLLHTAFDQHSQQSLGVLLRPSHCCVQVTACQMFWLVYPIKTEKSKIASHSSDLHTETGVTPPHSTGNHQVQWNESRISDSGMCSTTSHPSYSCHCFWNLVVILSLRFHRKSTLWSQCWIMIRLARTTPLGRSWWEAKPRAPGWNTGPTCWPTPVAPSRSGIHCCQRRRWMPPSQP